MPGRVRAQPPVGPFKRRSTLQRHVQVVLARTSALLGKTVRETRFRTRFDAAIVALHRAGQRLRTRIGDIELAVRPRASFVGSVSTSCTPVSASMCLCPDRTRIEDPKRMMRPCTIPATHESGRPLHGAVMLVRMTAALMLTHAYASSLAAGG